MKAPGGRGSVLLRSDAFVAVVVDKRNRVFAHLCDGEQVAEWFTGTLAKDGSLDLRSEGGAAKNCSTGFIDPLDDLVRPSRPVDAFVSSDVDL